MEKLDHLIPVMQKILASEVLLGPALASAGIGGLDKKAYDIVYQHAAELAEEICGNQPFTLAMYPNIQVTLPMVQSALIETISSTAAYLSHVRLGYLNIDDPMIFVAHRLVRKMLHDFGRDDVLTLNFVVNGYDNCKVVHHYGRVLESQFVSGELHRPWIQYKLDLELAVHLLTGTMKLILDGNEHYVGLTEIGNRRYRQFAEFLGRTGFLRRRSDLARRSHFSQLEEYDEVIRSLTNIERLREDVLRESKISPGMRVLELGCGTGEMTLSAGLFKLVGSDGEITATDPSVGMLARANRKLRDFPATNVKFVQAAAEDLPFEDNTFDAVVGCLFLHFTDIPTVLREVHRVCKPGAMFTTIYGLQFPRADGFFTEWFAPVLFSGASTEQKIMLPDEATVSDAIRELPYESTRIASHEVMTYYQYPEMAVKFTVQVANFFDAAMEELPWKAQQETIETLVQRGHDILRKHGAERLVQIHPGQFLQASVVK